MPFCFKCGSEVGDHMDFCPNCGTAREKPSKMASSAPSAQASTTPTDIVVVCPSCSKRYRVSEKHFQGKAQFKFKCSNCQTIVTATNTQLASSPAAPVGGGQNSVGCQTSTPDQPEEIIPDGFSEIGLKSIDCKNCGGTLLFDPNTPIAICSFCGSRFLLKTAIDKPLTDPLWIVPFSVEQNDFKRRLLSWMIEGDHTPNDILEKAEIGESRSVFAPFFAYDIEWSTNWSASIGHWREEHYQEWVTPWGEPNGKKVLKDKVRRVTDWSPLSGHSEGLMHPTLLASKRLPRALEFIGPAAAKMQAITGKLICGHAIEPFEVSAKERLQEESRKLGNTIAEAIHSKLPGDEQKNVNIADAVTSFKFKKCLLPAWMAKYKYGDHEYEVYADGSSGVVEGSRPESSSQKEAARSLYAGFKKLAIIFGAIIGGWFLLAAVVSMVVVDQMNYNSEKADPFVNGGLTPCCCTWLVALVVFGVILWNKYSEARKHEKDAIEHGLAVRKKSLEDRLKSEGL